MIPMKMAGYSEKSDLELVHLLKQDNKDAFTEIYDRYFQLLYVHTYNRLKEKDQAKDIVQELFGSIWEKRDVLEIKQNLASYLYASVRNHVLNNIARNQLKFKYELRQSSSINMNYEAADFLLRERQLALIIEEEIQALPKKMKRVFELSRKANLSHKEIAEKLNISEQTVRTHIKHALRLLRSRFGMTIFLHLLIYFFKI